MDWCLCSNSVTWVCAVLDDAIRMILPDGELSAARAEISINIPWEADVVSKYPPYKKLAQIMEQSSMRINGIYCEILGIPLRYTVRR